MFPKNIEYCTPEEEPMTRYDVLIVGGGPGGMQAAVAAASEGLTTCVLEKDKVGGQIGQTPRLENSIIAPKGGITGPQFAATMRSQAEAMGVKIVAGEAKGLFVESGVNVVYASLTNHHGQRLEATNVVLAMGSGWQHLDIPGLKAQIGKRVHYGPLESLTYPITPGLQVAVFGGGPSAGQAIIALAERGAVVHVLLRSTLKMPQYLVDTILDFNNAGQVVIHEHVKLERITRGAGGMLVYLKGRTAHPLAASAMFMCNGLVPNTGWIGETLARDEDGRIVTQLPSLQTNLAGVYAVGDCRVGSTPRVGVAIGDGSMVVTEIWRRLAGLGHRLTK
jgi:thioredoxin reductase (NADPH)